MLRSYQLQDQPQLPSVNDDQVLFPLRDEGCGKLLCSLRGSRSQTLVWVRPSGNCQAGEIPLEFGSEFFQYHCLTLPICRMQSRALWFNLSQ